MPWEVQITGPVGILDELTHKWSSPPRPCRSDRAVAAWRALKTTTAPVARCGGLSVDCAAIAGPSLRSPARIAPARVST